jgi:hypothetical protein
MTDPTPETSAAACTCDGARFPPLQHLAGCPVAAAWISRERTPDEYLFPFDFRERQRQYPAPSTENDDE